MWLVVLFYLSCFTYIQNIIGKYFSVALTWQKLLWIRENYGIEKSLTDKCFSKLLLRRSVTIYSVQVLWHVLIILIS